MKKKALFIMVFTMAVGLSACAAPNVSNNDTQSGATLSRFSVGEIQEYQGKLLSPAIGPRDNSIAGVQKVDMTTYHLRINGLVENKLNLNYDDVLKLTSYEKLITLNCVEGWSARILWKGVSLEELINLAVADSKAVTVIFHSIDNYTTSLPLSVIKDKHLILAYSSNGIVLPAEMGYPFIVVAEDKLGYKWARWVTSIELSDNANYKGYWEQRGYDNQADTVN